jgi:hypothetical protein
MERVSRGAVVLLTSKPRHLWPETISRSSSAPEWVAQKKHSSVRAFRRSTISLMRKPSQDAPTLGCPARSVSLSIPGGHGGGRSPPRRLWGTAPGVSRRWRARAGAGEGRERPSGDRDSGGRCFPRRRRHGRSPRRSRSGRGSGPPSTRSVVGSQPGCGSELGRSRSRKVWGNERRHSKLSASPGARNDRGNPPRSQRRSSAAGPTSSRARLWSR